MKRYITGAYHPESAKVVEALCQKLKGIAGVTLDGNRLTIRWNQDDGPVWVHAAVLEVNDGIPECKQCGAELTRERVTWTELCSNCRSPK